MFDNFQAYDVQETRRVSREEGRIEGKIEGEQLLLIKLVIKKLEKNYSAEQIAEILEESLDTIQPIYDIALRQAPDYNTDKVFYIENSSMISLGGGFSLFNFVIDKINSGELENEESFLELCKIAMVNKGIFSAHEDKIMISSPKFSYGTVEYNFATKKINKGTSSEKGSFEEFKAYVLDILK